MIPVDIAFLIRSKIRAIPQTKNQYFWDVSSDQQLTKIINRMRNQSRPDRIQVRKVIQDLKPVSLLDVGSGLGDEYIASGGDIGTYICLDRSKKILAEARKKKPTPHITRGDAEALPFRNQEFDVVLLEHILEHLPGYETGINEALRVAEKIVIADFFQLMPGKHNIVQRDMKGYHNNWYGKTGFEEYLRNNRIHFDYIKTESNFKRTGYVYVLHK